MMASHNNDKYAPLMSVGRGSTKASRKKKSKIINIALILLMVVGIFYLVYHLSTRTGSNYNNIKDASDKNNRGRGFEIGNVSINPALELSKAELNNIPKSLLPRNKLRTMVAINDGDDEYMNKVGHEELHDTGGTYGIIDSLMGIGETPTNGEWKDVFKDMKYWIANTDPPIIVSQLKYPSGNIVYQTPPTIRDSAQALSGIVTATADAIYEIDTSDLSDSNDKSNVTPVYNNIIDVGCDYTTPYIGIGLYSMLAASRGINSVHCVLPPAIAKKVKIPLQLSMRMNLFDGNLTVHTARVLNTKGEKGGDNDLGVESLSGIPFPSVHTALLRFSTDSRVTYDAWKSAKHLYEGPSGASQVLIPISSNMTSTQLNDILETMSISNYTLHMVPFSGFYDATLKSKKLVATEHNMHRVQTSCILVLPEKYDELVRIYSTLSPRDKAATFWWTREDDINRKVLSMHHPSEHNHR